MADKDAIGALGLDTKEFVAAVKQAVSELGKLNSAAESTDKSTKKLSSGMQAAKGFLGAAGIATTVAAAGAALLRFGMAVKDFGQTVSKAGENLQGSQRFENIKSAAGGGDAFAAAGSAALDQFAEQAKARIMGEAAKEAAKVVANVQAAAGVAKEIGDDIKDGFESPAWDGFREGMKWIKEKSEGVVGGVAGFGQSIKPDVVKRMEQLADEKMAMAKERGNAIQAGAESIRKSEDEIAKKQEEGVITYAQKVALATEEIQLLQTKVNYYSQEDTYNRQALNSAKAQLGAQEVALANLYFQRGIEQQIERTKTQALALDQSGMSNVSKYVKTRMEYQVRILQAQRDGNKELEKELTLRGNMELKEIKAAEHNLTPGELRDERRAARKMERDAKHQEARDRDFQDRARRGATGQTKGSRFDRWKQRNAALAAAGAQDMTVNEIKAATISATNFTLTAQ